jgi:protoporphyrinogen/coproporphyrinogen III oxidase
VKIIVIGAGISGLTSALRLQQQGHEVEVLEATDRVGGRCGVIRRDGFIIDTGPDLTPASYERYFHLASELGLAGDIVPSSTVTALVRNGKAHDINMSRPLSAALTPALSFGAKLRLLFGVLRHRKLIKRANGYRMIDVAELEDPNLTAESFSVDAFGREAADYLIDALMKPLAGTHMSKISALMVLGILNSWSAAMVTLRGGLYRLPEKLAEKVKVRLHSRVTLVQESNAGVEVHLVNDQGETEILHADACLIASVYKTAEQIYPPLRELSDHYGDKLKGCPIIDIKLAYGKATVSKAFPGFVSTLENRDMMMYCLEHNKCSDRAPAGHSLFTVYTETDSWDKLNRQTDEQLIAWARQQIEPLYPEVAGHFLFGIVNRQPWAAALADPDFHRRTDKLRQALEQPSRVEIGGDILGQGSMEAAVLWGEEAAKRLLNKLEPT